MNNKLPAKSTRLSKMISVKSAELTKLCLKNGISLLDPEVYIKSIELDELVVQYMKSSKKNK